MEKRDQYGKTAIHYAAATCNVDVSIADVRNAP